MRVARGSDRRGAALIDMKGRSGVLRIRSQVRVAVILLAAMTTSGCLFGSNKPKAPPQGAADADKFLFDKGTALLAKKNWLTAREYFKRLVDGYPQSPYRADA